MITISDYQLFKLKLAYLVNCYQFFASFITNHRNKKNRPQIIVSGLIYHLLICCLAPQKSRLSPHRLALCHQIDDKQGRFRLIVPPLDNDRLA